MKTCVSCGLDKMEEEFNWRYKLFGIRQPSCRDCQHKYQARFYQNHQEEEKERTRRKIIKARERNRDFVYSYKLTHPCQVCGETDPEVLEFDHVRGKGANINQLVNQGVPIKRLEIEIRRCQVLCSNCHRRKTNRESRERRR